MKTKVGVEDSMDNEDIMNTLKKVAGLFEVYHVTTFRGYRTNSKGITQELTIDILDSEGQYTCIVTSNDGKTTTGNPGASLDLVLRTVHWADLDK